MARAKKEMSLEELRAAALGAWSDHQADMKSDPAYREAVVEKYGKDRLADAK